MCELLGMDCNVPTDIVFSFSGLRQRGGKTAPHADGWGLALYDGPVARVFLDPNPAAASPLARFVAENPMKTRLAIGHVRRRTRGRVCVANTHPFVRELWGRNWVFAHNGTVPDARRKKLGRFRPLGTTDSEHAYCHLLGALAAAFPAYPRRPSELWRAVADLGGEIGAGGTFNFLLGDGRHLFARCATNLHHVLRKAPFGLATLADDDVRVDFSKVTTPHDRVAVVATRPLTTNETWTRGEPGELWVFAGGALRATLRSVATSSRALVATRRAARRVPHVRAGGRLDAPRAPRIR
jgi:glutamine amidotransferase